MIAGINYHSNPPTRLPKLNVGNREANATAYKLLSSFLSSHTINATESKSHQEAKPINMGTEHQGLITANKLRDGQVVFLTAANVDAKRLNNHLTRLVDFNDGDGFETAKNVLFTSETLPEEKIKSATLPPVAWPAEDKNYFEGMGFQEIFEWVCENEMGLLERGFYTGVWIIIDQVGLDTGTVVLCEEVDEEENDWEVEDKSPWRGTRLKCEEAPSLLANVSIGNLCFEEYLHEHGYPPAQVSEEGLWEKSRTLFPPGLYDEYDKRNAVLEILRQQGHVD
ncbi:hypothetical protein B0O99DRAFT_744844 [Bisporella sp. PMI_857]|nr:hypothetical protein B0O99DRAFT_744844 [Bisporella sp. PMI_857]